MKEQKLIGLCLKAQNNSFWDDVKKGFETSIKENPKFKLLVKSASAIDKLEEQINILQSFIDNKVDAIVLAPSDPDKLISILKRINLEKIPLFIIDSKINEKLAIENNIDYHSITFDDYLGGRLTGEFLLENLEANSEVAIIEGYKRGSYVKRVKGFKDSIKNKLSIVETVSANFEENKAFQKTKSLIKKFPNLKAIFATSDNMALGCYMALLEENRLDVKISGFDLTLAGSLAIERGEIISSIDSEPSKFGQITLTNIESYFSKNEFERHVQYKVKLVSKKNITKVPKNVFQKRKYLICKAEKDLSEFNYKIIDKSLTCPIIIGKNMYEDLPKRLDFLNADKFVIITDSIVKELYGNKLKEMLEENNLKTEMFSFKAGEKNKTFSTLNELASKVLSSNISKKSVLILLGGGVVGNLGGFLSSMIMRGLRYVQVPTTVMHQADSSTGGKQAVNTRHGKNLLGTFYEPEFIYNDITTIETLPQREYRSGLAEVIKHGLCESKELLELVSNGEYIKILEKTLSHKIKIMEEDPREINKGFILIYGHTLGHAIEILEEDKLLHGEAISIGMVLAANISVELNLAEPKLLEFHREIFSSVGLPTKIPKHLKAEQIMNSLFFDKKEREKNMTFCLLSDVGVTYHDKNNFSVPVPKEIIKKVIKNNY